MYNDNEPFGRNGLTNRGHAQSTMEGMTGVIMPQSEKPL